MDNEIDIVIPLGKGSFGATTKNYVIALEV